MKEDIVLANESLNKWCNTEGINYYEGDTALGFLFRYAVPKVITNDRYSLELTYYQSHCEAHIRPHYYGDKHYSASNKDPAPALFWAILEALKKEYGL